MEIPTKSVTSVNADYLPVALRVYTEGRGQDGRTTDLTRTKPAIIPELILTLDVETSVDQHQRLLFGTARVSRVRQDSTLLRARLVQEIMFYADDLPQRDPEGFRILRRHAKREGLRFLSQRQFLDRVLWRIGVRARAALVGFNQPFDYSRLAYGCGITPVLGRGGDRFAGGFSLLLWRYRDQRGVWKGNRYRPRLIVKHIDRSRALKAFSGHLGNDAVDRIPEGSRDGRPDPKYHYRGNLIDLHQFGFAMDDKRYPLAQACEEYGVEHTKLFAPVHGLITDDYVGYARRDTLATEELFCKMMSEFVKHPIDLQPSKAFSPASIAKAYLHAMRIRPILQRQPDFPKSALSIAMNAFYGGRAECRIRRTAVPVAHMDFTSMYPTVFTLLGLWDLLTCRRIEVIDATKKVRKLLQRSNLADYCLSPEAWREIGCCFVQVRPQEDIVPVRARYGHGRAWNIGVNSFARPEPQWFALPDVIASAILTGRSPRVACAIRLVPVGVSHSLRPVRFGGTVAVDPVHDNFFKMAIEERKRPTNGQDPRERARLDLALKIVANAGAYGIFAEFNRRELPNGESEEIFLYRPDGSRFHCRVAAPEEPGEFAFPPIAASVTAAARLMLSLTEHLVRNASGEYAFGDTDSMAVVATKTGGLVPCPGGPERLPDGRDAIRALSWTQVDMIRERFAKLNPYDRSAVPGSILRLEERNFDPARQQKQLWCWAISAKRYALFNWHEDGTVTLPGKPIEHGLGHLLNPVNPEDPNRDWIRTLWEGILTEEVLGKPYPWPQWLSRPAVGRVTVSSQSRLRLFDSYNEGKAYPDQIKPFNFLLIAFVAPFGHPDGADPNRFQLVAPWCPDGRRWLEMMWIDRDSGKKFRVTTDGHSGGDGVARVKTYADVLAEYRVHPEEKSLGPDGLPCGRKTRGLLRRRSVITTTALVALIGKESNKLEDREADTVHDVDEVLTEYRDPRRDPWRTLILPVLKDTPTSELNTRTNMPRRTLQSVKARGSYPQPDHRAALAAVAALEARRALRRWQIEPPLDDLACCAAYLEERERRSARLCPVCHGPMPLNRRHYCSSACRQRAYRQRGLMRDVANEKKLLAPHSRVGD